MAADSSLEVGVQDKDCEESESPSITAKENGNNTDANDDSEGDLDNNGSNPGWADAMARVLKSRKPKKSRSIVLSRAKKLNEAAKTVEEESGLEIEIKHEVSNANEQHSRRKQRELQSKFRVKPSIQDRDHEKKLNRIATRGVVQLFNAVRQQQKSLESQLKEVGSSERKRDKVMKSLDKRAFLDILMGASRDDEPVDSPVKAEVKNEEEELPTWQVLRDDFMMGTARLKDWDKNDAPT